MSARIRFVVCLLFAVSIIPASGAEVPAASLAGDWQGTLDAGVKLRLVVHLEVTEDGGLTGTLDSIDQGAMGLPIDTVVLEGRALRLELSVVAGVFDFDIPFQRFVFEVVGNHFAPITDRQYEIAISLAREEFHHVHDDGLAIDR